MSNVWPSENLNELRVSNGEVERLSSKATSQQNDWSQSILPLPLEELMQDDLRPLEGPITYNEFLEVETQQTQQIPGRFSVTLKSLMPGGGYTMPVLVGKHNMSMVVATSIYGPHGGGRW